MTRVEAGVIDDCVPVSPFQRIKLIVPVADQCLDVRKHTRRRLATIEHADVVAAGSRVINLMRPDEACAAENQDVE